MNKTEENRENLIMKSIHNYLYPPLPYRSVEKNYDSSSTQNHNLCSKCKGECCKSCGCHFSPDDFKEISFEYLKSELEKGYISIDVVLGEKISSTHDTYILRIRNQGAPIVDMRIRKHKETCILLTDTGCKLDYAHRPSGGKLLIPRFTIGYSCYNRYDIRKCCYEWLPHKETLKQLIDYFEYKDLPCTL